MTKFNKQEIELCRKIAEKERKEIVRGGCYVHAGDKKNMAVLHLSHTPIAFDNLIPLWTLSDCLEWLDKTKDVTLRICSHPNINQTTVEYDDIEYYGKTPLEACLKAVLAVLEEK